VAVAHGNDFLVQACLYFAAAVAAVMISHRLRLGSVGGHLLARPVFRHIARSGLREIFTAIHECRVRAAHHRDLRRAATSLLAP
jgi:Kef-type K+ transport system membrane component KefB